MNIEHLNGYNTRIIWSSDASRAQQEFQRRAPQQRIADQEQFDNTTGNHSLKARIGLVIDLITGSNNATSSSVVSSNGSLIATPEEIERQRRDNMGI